MAAAAGGADAESEPKKLLLKWCITRRVWDDGPKSVLRVTFKEEERYVAYIYSKVRSTTTKTKVSEHVP